MSKFQIATIGFAVILFLGLYLGVPTKPRDRAQINKTRALQAEEASTITVDQLLKAAKGQLDKSQLASILQLEKQLETTQNSKERSDLLKSISSEWNKLNRFALGGFYAEQVADIAQSDTAWSIVGTTYYSGFQQSTDSLTRKYCVDKAIKAFENAISFSPDNSSHKVNLGLCYVNGSGNPMKGILMIRDLADKNPKDVLASTTLGKLSLRTGQYEKAIGRFKNAIQNDPTNVDAHYWLAQAYIESGDKTKGKIQLNKCLQLTNDKVFVNRVQSILKTL